MSASRPKLVQTTPAVDKVTHAHFWQVWLSGDNEKDSFIINATTVGEVNQLAINEYYRRNGIGPVSVDKILQKS